MGLQSLISQRHTSLDDGQPLAYTALDERGRASSRAMCKPRGGLGQRADPANSDVDPANLEAEPASSGRASFAQC
jgi:hypothetical protein